MLERIIEKFNSMLGLIEKALFGYDDSNNTYCIPCTWTITGKVYVKAPNADVAKAYLRTERINPDIEDCYCLNVSPDTEHPILCQCGNCGNEYVISKIHIPLKCPYCENGY